MTKPFLLAAIYAIVAVASCTSPDTLDTGDTLTLAVAPDQLLAHSLPDAGVATAGDCTAAGGSVVSLAAVSADGSPAGNRNVTVWLDPAMSAILAPLSLASANPNNLAIAVVKLDGNEAGSTCLLPGNQPGSVTVHARSGVVLVSRNLALYSATQVSAHATGGDRQRTSAGGDESNQT